MLDGLAFLPLDEVNNGMDFLKANTPEGLEDLVQYFDTTYVSGSYRRIQPPPEQPDGPLPAIRVHRAPPLFSRRQYGMCMRPQLLTMQEQTTYVKAGTLLFRN